MLNESPETDDFTRKRGAAYKILLGEKPPSSSIMEHHPPSGSLDAKDTTGVGELYRPLPWQIGVRKDPWARTGKVAQDTH